MIVAAQFSLQRYARWAPWLYLLGVGTLVAVMMVGVGAKGAQRWLQIGPLQIQPSEFKRIARPPASRFPQGQATGSVSTTTSSIHTSRGRVIGWKLQVPT